MKVFVDSSALYAILDEDDPNHADAAWSLTKLVEVADLVSHNYVQLESEVLVRRRFGIDAVASLVDRLLPGLMTIWVDAAIHAAAVEAWRAGGGRVSLVDHVSFIVMRQLQIDVAFSYDADFERHGFRRPHLPPDGARRRVSEASAPYAAGLPGDSELVSVAEIALRAGRSRNTIQSWRRRHRDFPRPAAALATGPVWSWPAIEHWIGLRRPPRTPALAATD